MSYEIIENNDIVYNYEEDNTVTTVNKDSCDIKEVWKKLKQLEHNLHINNICDKNRHVFGVYTILKTRRFIFQNIILKKHITFMVVFVVLNVRSRF